MIYILGNMFPKPCYESKQSLENISTAPWNCDGNTLLCGRRFKLTLKTSLCMKFQRSVSSKYSEGSASEFQLEVNKQMTL